MRCKLSLRIGNGGGGDALVWNAPIVKAKRQFTGWGEGQKENAKRQVRACAFHRCVFRARLPQYMPHVSWVCWFFTQLRHVFPRRIIRFSCLLKTQTPCDMLISAALSSAGCHYWSQIAMFFSCAISLALGVFFIDGVFRENYYIDLH